MCKRSSNCIFMRLAMAPPVLFHKRQDTWCMFIAFSREWIPALHRSNSSILKIIQADKYMYMANLFQLLNTNQHDNKQNEKNMALSVYIITRTEQTFPYSMFLWLAKVTWYCNRGVHSIGIQKPFLYSFNVRHKNDKVITISALFAHRTAFGHHVLHVVID